MKEQKRLSLAFIIILLSTIICSSWLIFNIITDISLLLTENKFQIILVIICICFILSIFLLKKILVEIRYETDKNKENERNIRDVYLYNQLLDPPSTNN